MMEKRGFRDREDTSRASSLDKWDHNGFEETEHTRRPARGRGNRPNVAGRGTREQNQRGLEKPGPLRIGVLTEEEERLILRHREERKRAELEEASSSSKPKRGPKPIYQPPPRRQDADTKYEGRLYSDRESDEEDWEQEAKEPQGVNTASEDREPQSRHHGGERPGRGRDFANYDTNEDRDRHTREMWQDPVGRAGQGRGRGKRYQGPGRWEEDEDAGRREGQGREGQGRGQGRRYQGPNRWEEDEDARPMRNDDGRTSEAGGRGRGRPENRGRGAPDRERHDNHGGWDESRKAGPRGFHEKEARGQREHKPDREFSTQDPKYNDTREDRGNRENRGGEKFNKNMNDRGEGERHGDKNRGGERINNYRNQDTGIGEKQEGREFHKPASAKRGGRGGHVERTQKQEPEIRGRGAVSYVRGGGQRGGIRRIPQERKWKEAEKTDTKGEKGEKDQKQLEEDKNPVILLLKIEVENGTNEEITGRLHDRPVDLAKQFCLKHNMDRVIVPQLSTFIEEHLSGAREEHYQQRKNLSKESSEGKEKREGEQREETKREEEEGDTRAEGIEEAKGEENEGDEEGDEEIEGVRETEHEGEETQREEGGYMRAENLEEPEEGKGEATEGRNLVDEQDEKEGEPEERREGSSDVQVREGVTNEGEERRGEGEETEGSPATLPEDSGPQ